MLYPLEESVPEVDETQTGGGDVANSEALPNGQWEVGVKTTKNHGCAFQIAPKDTE